MLMGQYYYRNISSEQVDLVYNTYVVSLCTAGVDTINISSDAGFVVLFLSEA